MLITILPLVILTFATYRITRFFLFDTIIEGTRHRWYNRLLKKDNLLRNKLVELTSCSWCFGVHASYALLSLYLRVYPWQLGVNGWITVAAIAGAAGLLHAYEPNGEPEDH